MQALHAPTPTVGTLLQHWRRTRHLSQLALAHEADVSPRHVCFVETGRAKPSRDMIVRLSTVLDVPLRERNAMLLAGGFAPMYSEAKLDAPELGPVRAALDAILKQQEPYPAVVMNRHWDVIEVNQAAQRFFAFLLGATRAQEPANVITLMFDPNGLRPWVLDWEVVAESLIERVHRECVGGVKDEATHKVLTEALAQPHVPTRFAKTQPGAAPLPVLPIAFQKDGKCFNYFSAVTTLGTPQDVTLQEIRIESFFPVDRLTEQLARELALTPE